MSGQTANFDAVRALARARAAHDQIVSPENNLFIRELVGQALGSLGGATPPWLAEAWALFADVLVSDYLHRWNDAGKDQLDQAQSAVDQALAIDGSLALAHYVCGFVHRANGRHKEARDAFHQAIVLDGNFARAYAQKGNELINLGQPGKAPPLVQKAIELSPLDPSMGMFYWIIGRAYFFSGFYQDAIPWLEKSVETRKTVWYNRSYLVSSHALLGQQDSATVALNDFLAQPQFANYTLETVIDNEKANPNDDDTVKSGRTNHHGGLLKAGLPEK
jgi:tetratricopeptide (TPR) repeat protein